MTKFALMFVIFAALCGNATAQDNDPPDPSAGAGTTTVFNYATTYQACMDEHRDDLDFKDCCNDVASCERQRTDSERLLTDVATNRGQSPSELAEQDCRSRNGFFSESAGCQCTTTEHPNHQWVSSSESEHECCVQNVNAYNRRRGACQDSGGSWTCRGECRCPNQGQQLVNGVCEGDATTREEVERMRDRIPELEGELARLQAERDALQARFDQAQIDLARVGELEGELAELAASVEEMEGQLVDMDAELSFLRHLREQYERHIERQAEMIAELGGVPPAPLPGTAESIAEVAGETEPGPLAPTPPPEEEEETTWCEENGWACAGIIIGAIAAVAGATTLGVCAAGYCDEGDSTTRYSYH